jgi:hypothetical protein
MVGQTGVILIAASSLDWEKYLKDVAELTGHSPTRLIDRSSIEWSPWAKYLISLGDFHARYTPNDSLKNDSLLTHLSFSFLIDAPGIEIYRIMELTDLSVISAARSPKGRVAIVSGNLKQWKYAITTILESKRRGELCWAFNACHQTFCRLGLTGVWSDYRKRSVDENTYLLEYKP